MKKLLGVLTVALVSSHGIFADFTDGDLQQVVTNWDAFTAYQPDDKIIVKVTDMDIARTLSDRVLAFIGYQLEAQLLLAQTKPKGEVEKGSNVSYAWQELYRLQPSLRERLAACNDEDCVKAWVEYQKLLFNWIERIGTEKTIVAQVTSAVGNAITKSINRVSRYFCGEGKPALVLEPSMVKAIYTVALANIDTMEKTSVYRLDNLDIQNLRVAYKVLLGQLARSALSKTADNSMFVLSKEGTFTAEWRYSENQWLKDIMHARIAHLKGKAPAFIVGMRREYAGQHKLSCHNPSHSDIPGVSRASMLIGMQTYECTSEQGGRYQFSATTAGLDTGIGMKVGGDIFLRSVVPGHWFTPEGYSFGFEAGVMLGVGGHLGAAIRLDGIRLYTDEIEFGVGGGVDIKASSIKQIRSSHEI